MIARLCSKVFLILFLFTDIAFASVVVNSPAGIIEGQQSLSYESFLGIPYAKVPEGNLRYAPPTRRDNFSQPFKADRYCKIAYQITSPATVDRFGMGDDSLCLNIFRPKNVKEDAKLPVFFWIHGGAYVQGSSATYVHPVDSFVENGIIVVTVNYRLQFQGFMSTVQTFNEHGTTGNFGHLDILEALKWTHDNIKSFGGDPDNVTVAGHSAGAMAASALILSPLSEGLFKRAFLQSGTILNYPFSDFTYNSSKQRAFSQTKKILLSLGLDDNYESMKALREIEPTILTYYSPYDFNFVTGKSSYLNPLFDGYFLPKEPYLALKRGAFNKVSLMLGYVSDEGTLFSDKGIKDSEFKKGIENNFGQNKALDIYSLYKDKRLDTAYKKESALMSDMSFTLGMKLFADSVSEFADVYMYHFAYAEKEELAYGFGVYHGIELASSFNAHKTPSKNQKKIASIFHNKLVNFIKNGNPNEKTEASYLIDWPLYDKNSSNVFRFDRISGIEELKIKGRLSKLENIIFEEIL